jgi:hypothetical protein
MFLSCWDGEMMRDNTRCIIILEFDRKIAYKLLLFEPSRPQLKLGSFNDQVRIVQAKLARAWAESEVFYAVLTRVEDTFISTFINFLFTFYF